MKPKQTEAPRPTGGQTKRGKREKLFGSAAERISREEHNAVVDEIRRKAGGHFQRIEVPEQLADKESFGDIDLISLTDADYNEEFFRRVFGDDMLEYSHTKRSSLYQILLRLESGKTAQVDLMKAKDEADFECKKTYYSKGHLSPMVGILAQNLHFKYGTEGFFKRYKDSKGQWHDILITKDLREGLRMLGYDLAAYEAVKTNDDIPVFVTTSPYFDSGYFRMERSPSGIWSMKRHHREAMRRIPRQEELRAALAASDEKREIEDEDHYFKNEELFPGWYEKYKAKVKEIEEQIRRRSKARAKRLRERSAL